VENFTKRALKHSEPGAFSLVKKAELRKIAKARIAALSPDFFFTSGLAAAQQLSSIPRWIEFRSVLVFLSMKDEIDTLSIVETVILAGKPLFAPRIEGNTLVFYRYTPDVPDLKGASPWETLHSFEGGYREPAADPALILKEENFPILVITPGLAFDRRLNRLGRGRGYYDRFFAGLDSTNRNYTALGLCMNSQLFDKIPADLRDKRMDILLTESGFVALE